MAGWDWQVSGAVVYFRATCVVLTTDSIIVKGEFRICPIGSGVSTYQQRWAKRPAILELIQCTTPTYSKHNRSTVTTGTTAGLGLHFQNKKYRRYSSSGAANEGTHIRCKYLAVIGLAVQHGNKEGGCSKPQTVHVLGQCTRRAARRAVVHSQEPRWLIIDRLPPCHVRDLVSFHVVDHGSKFNQTIVLSRISVRGM